jgi:hypothetical protein
LFVCEKSDHYRVIGAEESQTTESIPMANFISGEEQEKDYTMSNIHRTILAAGLLIALFSVAPLLAHADQQKATVRAGYLKCEVSSGWGFVFGSSRSMHCSYAMQAGYTEYYTGSISKFGADIGYLSSAVMIWAVLAPTNNLGQGALAGHYAGATASAAVGVGAGANVLVGGFKNSIALQPITIEGQNGLNVAAGVAAMSLHFNANKPAKVS